jgi:NAD+ synthase (glutamine-hydrolysing)
VSLPFGFMRVAAATPRVRVADCRHNSKQILGLMERAIAEGIEVLVFPELTITGYTCADLFHQRTLQDGALDALQAIAREGTGYSAVAIIGVPLVVDDQLFNCAAVIHGGKILGVVPKTFIPNYKEFYEARWFASAQAARSRQARIGDLTVPFGNDLLFAAQDLDGLVIGVEICEDLWVPVPRSSLQSLAGATVLANPSASNDVIGKSLYRRDLVQNQSGRCLAAYIYAASGAGESSTDVVFGGHSMIAENASMLAENRRFGDGNELLIADIDLDRLRIDRLRMNSFIDARGAAMTRDEWRRIEFRMAPGKGSAASALPLRRSIDPHPFVPAGNEHRRERCEEIFGIQVAGLVQRLTHVKPPHVTIGVSGGLDSALALLVACKSFDRLGWGRKRIHAFTLPGFGTSERTLTNARAMMNDLGVTKREIDIRPLCLLEWQSLGHSPFGIDVTGMDVPALVKALEQCGPRATSDLTFENVQARTRTSILMNSGFVIGTGDLSELALGWCTYNADHMSMYNANVTIPKTLVKFLVGWAAEHEFDGAARQVLLDVVATEISPELVPLTSDGACVQSTEAIIGPYELHDFFLYQMLRYGYSPTKILFLAEQAKFSRTYTVQELRHWLREFLERFFASQYKRSALPDGPKVGSISLSPRGDLRMPSDASVELWLEELRFPPTAAASENGAAGVRAAEKQATVPHQPSH